VQDDLSPFDQAPPCERTGRVNNLKWEGAARFRGAGQIRDDYRGVTRSRPFARQQINNSFDPANAGMESAVDEDFYGVPFLRARISPGCNNFAPRHRFTMAGGNANSQ